MRRDRLVDWGFTVLLVVVCGLCFFSVLEGRYTFPWDFISFMYPAQRFVHDAIRSGQAPLWNPYVFLGFPIMGDPQASIFNPVYLLYHLIPALPPLSLQVFAVLEIAHIAAAGVFTYWLARALDLHPVASFFAGVVYMLGGFFPIHVEHQTWVCASAWLPLLALLTVRVLEKPTARDAALVALVFAATFLAGYPQTALLAAYMLGFLFLWRAVQHLRQGRRALVARSALTLGVGLALGGAIAAVQLLPSAELTRYATRGSANFSGRVAGGIEISAPLTLALPTVFGSDQRSPLLGDDVTHNQIYLGLAPLLLALVGLATLTPAADKGAYHHYLNFFRLWTVIAFVGSFGVVLYVYRVFEWLPLMTIFRRAATLFPFAVLGAAIVIAMLCHTWAQPAPPPDAGPRRSWGTPRFSLGLALLAGAVLLGLYAATAWRPELAQGVISRFPLNPALETLATPQLTEAVQRGAQSMLPFLAGVLALLLAMWQWPAGRPLLALGLAVLTCYDLYTFNGNQVYNAYPVNKAYVLSDLPALDELRAPGGAWRVARAHYGGLDNIGSVVQVEDINGYNPLTLRRVIEFFRAMSSVNSRLFDLTNVRYVMVPSPFPETPGQVETFAGILDFWESDHIYVPSAPLDPAKFVLVHSDPGVWYELRENTRALPRFFTVRDVRVEPDPARRLAALADDAFDPGQTVILEEPFEVPLTGRLAQPVEIVDHSLLRYRLRAQVADGPALLVISLPTYPGWTARVNDSPAPIFIANHAFMAVPLAAGVETVDLRFEPLSYRVGLAVSVAGLVVCALLLLWSRLRPARGPA